MASTSSPNDDRTTRFVVVRIKPESNLPNLLQFLVQHGFYEFACVENLDDLSFGGKKSTKTQEATNGTTPSKENSPPAPSMMMQENVQQQRKPTTTTVSPAPATVSNGIDAIPSGTSTPIVNGREEQTNARIAERPSSPSPVDLIAPLVPTRAQVFVPPPSEPTILPIETVPVQPIAHPAQSTTTTGVSDRCEPPPPPPPPEITREPPPPDFDIEFVEAPPHQQEEAGISGATIPSSVPSDMNSDEYRKLIVSKGNGNADDCCQVSIDMIGARANPVMCKLSHVESPSLFWVQLFTNNLPSIEEDLNFELDERKCALSNPCPGDYCVAPVASDEDFHRAKILEIKENGLGTPFAKILYIDTGKIDWVSTRALVDIPRRYRHYQRQACPCALADIVPAGNQWSEDVVSAFREVCQSDENTQLYAEALDEGESPAINTVSLYRAKTDDPSKKETIVISLIKATKGKVRRGDRVIPMTFFGKEEGVEPAGGQKPPDETDGWRCTVRAMEEGDPMEQTELDDEAVVARAMEREVLRERLFADRPPLQTIPPAKVEQMPLNLVPLMDPVTSYIYFHVYEVVSPTNFYIQIMDSNGRNTDMEKLAIELNTFYSDPTNQMLVPPSSSDGVRYAVARSTIDGVTSFRRIVIKEWRASNGADAGRRDIRVSGIVVAIFVDYGYCQRLEGKDVFMLHPSFCTLPAQAFYCQLMGISPRDVFGSGGGGSRWDEPSMEIFKEYTTISKPLMRALVCSEQQPYELIMYRKEADGTDTCINKLMVESGLATSDMQFP